MFLWHCSAQCEQAGVTAIPGYFSCPHEKLSGYSVNIDLRRARTVATFVALPFFNSRAKITIALSFVLEGIAIKRITWLNSNSFLFCCSKQNCFQYHLSNQTTRLRDFTKSVVQMSIIIFSFHCFLLLPMYTFNKDTLIS